MKHRKKVLMCGSDLSVKGGMVSVIRNYLNYQNWEDIAIHYVPTYIEKSKIVIALYFLIAYIRVLFHLIFGKYDVLYVHTAERGSFYRKAMLIELAHKVGVKTVIHHHAAEFEEFYSSSNRKEYLKKILELADLNIVLSNRLIRMITDKAPKSNVKVLYNAVNTYPENPYNQDATNILFLGRFGKRKGIYDLLVALREIESELDTSVKLYLCGDGEIDEVKNKVEEYGLENRVEHVGWIEGKQKIEFFKNSMVNILPSYNEGLPMTILETMSYGIPNISTKIASIPEVIVDGVNGYMIKPGDIEALKKLLLEISADKKKRIDMSNLAYRCVMDSFSLSHHIGLLSEYLREL